MYIAIYIKTNVILKPAQFKLQCNNEV